MKSILSALGGLILGVVLSVTVMAHVQSTVLDAPSAPVIYEAVTTALAESVPATPVPTSEPATAVTTQAATASTTKPQAVAVTKTATVTPTKAKPVVKKTVATTKAVTNTTPKATPSKKAVPKPKTIQQDLLSKQKNVNADIRGRVRLGEIDQIVCYNPDKPKNETDFKYLHTGWDGKSSKQGAVFADYRMDGTLAQSDLTILYGHAYKGIFGKLAQFRQKAFFNANPTIQIDATNESMTAEIFAVGVYPRDDAIYRWSTRDPSAFVDEADFQDYLKQVTARAMFTRKDAMPELGDKIILCSTCAKDYSGARMVVLARVKGTPSAAVETASAKLKEV
jgi:SrtB family sortase